MAGIRSAPADKIQVWQELECFPAMLKADFVQGVLSWPVSMSNTGLVSNTEGIYMRASILRMNFVSALERLTIFPHNFEECGAWRSGHAKIFIK